MHQTNSNAGTLLKLLKPTWLSLSSISQTKTECKISSPLVEGTGMLSPLAKPAGRGKSHTPPMYLVGSQGCKTRVELSNLVEAAAIFQPQRCTGLRDHSSCDLPAWGVSCSQRLGDHSSSRFLLRCSSKEPGWIAEIMPGDYCQVPAISKSTKGSNPSFS